MVRGTPFIDEVPLPHFFGSGPVVSIPKKKWEQITGDDLETACGHAIRKGDVRIINTGGHHDYEDGDYFAYCPGLVPSAAEWMVEKGIKVVGHDTQANDHPLATAIGPQRNGPLLPHRAEEYKEWSGGNDWKDDFPEWEPVHNILFKHGILGIENVGRDLDLRDILAQLEEIRRNGLAYDIDEHTQGISAVGFAFQDSSDVRYAISVPVPSTRFQMSRKTIEHALRKTKDQVGQIFDLGG